MTLTRRGFLGGAAAAAMASALPGTANAQDRGNECTLQDTTSNQGAWLIVQYADGVSKAFDVQTATNHDNYIRIPGQNRITIRNRTLADFRREFGYTAADQTNMPQTPRRDGVWNGGRAVAIDIQSRILRQVGPVLMQDPNIVGVGYVELHGEINNSRCHRIPLKVVEGSRFNWNVGAVQTYQDIVRGVGGERNIERSTFTGNWRVGRTTILSPELVR